MADNFAIRDTPTLSHFWTKTVWICWTKTVSSEHTSGRHRNVIPQTILRGSMLVIAASITCSWVSSLHLGHRCRLSACIMCSWGQRRCSSTRLGLSAHRSRLEGCCHRKWRWRLRSLQIGQRGCPGSVCTLASRRRSTASSVRLSAARIARTWAGSRGWFRGRADGSTRGGLRSYDGFRLLVSL